jgi:hypothetical protein
MFAALKQQSQGFCESELHSLLLGLWTSFVLQVVSVFLLFTQLGEQILKA